ncbi:MAG: UDP-glucose 4-epimerase GalE [Alphaproteobacteria bacterium]|nr:UDP-glucose 4-epimerase GalE [Alphaproteobacteria bacterium]
MRVLVTGGAGYVGSHACKALSQAGHEPVAADNLSQGRRSAVKWGPLEVGDVTDPAFLDAIFASHKPDAVMHFAALSLVGDSVARPAQYYRANVAGGIELLDAMRRAGIGVIVFSSSAAVYGVPDTSPILEDSPKAPINAYGATKLSLEMALKDYEKAYGLQWAALRYFNAAGADPDGEIGELHDPETHAIPLAVKAAMGQGGVFRLFGEDYPTEDGTCIRDYVHVTDLGDAHVKALEHLARGGESGAFNLGTSAGASVREIIAAVGAAAGRSVPVEAAPRRAGDPPILIASTARARTILGWTPVMSDMATIARTACAWHAKHAVP